MRGSALVLLASAATAGGDVWVVDDDGGADVDFLDLAPAVDAAASGDLVLVRAGTYSSFTVHGKSLAVVADVDQVVLVDETVRVEQVPFGENVALRGLELRGSVVSSGLIAQDVEGSLWVEDCILVGGSFGAFLPDGHGALLERCASVSISRCSLMGAPAFLFDDAHGLHAIDSSVVVGQSILDGGAGAPGGFGGSGGRGGDGGAGGDGPGPCGAGGDAGAAVAGVVAPEGAVAGSSHAGTVFFADAPVPEGETAFLFADGPTGDLALALISWGPSYDPLPGLGGVLLAGRSAFAVPLGTLPRGASLVHPVTVPAAPVGAPDARVAWLQGVTVGAGTGPLLSEASALPILDPAF